MILHSRRIIIGMQAECVGKQLAFGIGSGGGQLPGWSGAASADGAGLHGGAAGDGGGVRLGRVCAAPD